MTKPLPKIYTVVADVYDMIYNGVKKIPKKLLKEFNEDINQALTKALKDGCKSNKPYLRMSNIGTPARKLWYTLKGYPGSTPTAVQGLQFMYGHIIEAWVIFLVKLAGHIVKDQQKVVELDGVKGHQDAEIDGVIIDVKGMSPYGFDKFANGRILQDDTFGYIPQLSGYAQGQDRELAGFLAFDKQRGRMTMLLLDGGDMVDARQKIADARESLKSDTPPPRCYKEIEQGTSGNMALSKNCEYCPYKHECWKDVNDGQGLRAFKFKENGEETIRHLTVIKRKPRVEEVTNEKEEVIAEETIEIQI